MKRTLIITTFLAILGMALAGPPADFQLMCGEGEEATLVGVANLVEDQLKVALIDGALEACVDGVYGVADGATVFTMSYVLVDGALTDVQVVFEEDAAYAPALEYEEVPAVAVEGKLGAQQNRAEAFERAAETRARAEERRGGPPSDAPGEGDDDGDDEEEDEEEEGEEGEDVGETPAEQLPAPAASGRR